MNLSVVCPCCGEGFVEKPFPACAPCWSLFGCRPCLRCGAWHHDPVMEPHDCDGGYAENADGEDYYDEEPRGRHLRSI